MPHASTEVQARPTVFPTVGRLGRTAAALRSAVQREAAERTGQLAGPRGHQPGHIMCAQVLRQAHPHRARPSAPVYPRGSSYEIMNTMTH